MIKGIKIVHYNRMLSVQNRGTADKDPLELFRFTKCNYYITELRTVLQLM